MILSRRHNYIFLHCRKTAGSSIAVALSRDLGPDDLQLSGLKETVDAGLPIPSRVLREARQGLTGLNLPKRLGLLGLTGKDRQMKIARRLIRARYRPELGQVCQHPSASAVRATFPEEWDRMRKFCVVRNPWDKTASDYFWRIRDTAQPPSFDSFVRAMAAGDPLGGIVPVEVADNWPMYTIDDQTIADEVVRFEDLANALPLAMQRLSIPWDGWLPRAKSSHRPKTGKQALYTPELITIVGDLFHKEVEAFGYDYSA